MQCVVDSILPRCLGGQEARVLWLDLNLSFSARQLARLVGFEVLSRSAGQPCTFRPDGSFEHQMRTAEALEAALSKGPR